MSLDKRSKTIKAFNEDPTVTCFLMSLKAGGVALNLTVASHVMLMDPWWNPAVEQQAQARLCLSSVARHQPGCRQPRAGGHPW